MKTCNKCGIEKELDQFSPTSSYKGKICYRSDCRDCNTEEAKTRGINPEIRRRRADAAKARRRKNPEKYRAINKKWHLANPGNERKRKYGITEDQYQERLVAQGNKCAICAEDFKKSKKSGKLVSPHVDHDHKTGVVRGLLCYKCNAGIGLLGDSFSIIIRAADYLRKHIT